MKVEKLSLAELEKQSLAAYNEGRYVDAVHFGAQALKLAPANDLYKMRYAYFIQNVTVNEFRPDIKIALATCLKSDQIEHQKMWPAWASLLLKGPMYDFLFDDTIDPRKYWKCLDALLNDDFFLLGLRRFLTAHPEIEGALVRLRRALLEAAPNDNMLRGKHLPLLAALGVQCFFNEYVWNVSPEEEDAIAALTPASATQIGIASCYRPLSDYKEAPEWLAVHGKGPLEPVMTAQVGDWLTEQDIHKNLKNMAPIDEGTSKAVQAMYEENPYPRWTCIDRPFRIYDDVKLDWLTAGCGTGRPLSQLCVAFPNVDFTAVDLSRSSLAYAVRKTREAGGAKIDFYHGDLIDTAKLGKTFDFIESSGVLHHMKDPVAGWKALLSCLRPGGRIQIGLYSTMGRQDIFRVRDYIAKKGYAADRDGIRALRADMLALPDTDPLYPILSRHDFYATSECRDLVFHIQEATYTIPQLRQIMDDLGLAFLYFKLERRERAVYQKYFPDDPAMANLDNWHALEQKIPHLFAGMYKFFCCRKEEVESPLEKFTILEKKRFLIGY